MGTYMFKCSMLPFHSLRTIFRSTCLCKTECRQNLRLLLSTEKTVIQILHGYFRNRTVYYFDCIIFRLLTHFFSALSVFPRPLRTRLRSTMSEAPSHAVAVDQVR
jgi:hypothetical protein